MEQPRHLCSQLVKLTLGGVAAGRSAVANMEEIGRLGAVLECEEPVPTECPLEIRWDGILLVGRVTSVTRHEFGWRVEAEFSPLTPWALETGKPAHFFDLAEL